jgi:O-acetyl-ADP-ribose deacetylase
MNKMNISIILGDITKQQTKAIVNAANSSLLGGGGVDGAIHRAAGKELVQECYELHGCKEGNAKITKGYNLKAEYIIHAVGPYWSGGQNNEAQKLLNCYEACLNLCVQHHIKSISFPCISTGIFNFPQVKAANIAVQAVLDFPHEIEVVFCCFLESDYQIYKNILESYNE